jgi:hypothetical protein
METLAEKLLVVTICLLIFEQSDNSSAQSDRSQWPRWRHHRRAERSCIPSCNLFSYSQKRKKS